MRSWMMTNIKKMNNWICDVIEPFKSEQLTDWDIIWTIRNTVIGGFYIFAMGDTSQTQINAFKPRKKTLFIHYISPLI